MLGAGSEPPVTGAGWAGGAERVFIRFSCTMMANRGVCESWLS